MRGLLTGKYYDKSGRGSQANASDVGAQLIAPSFQTDLGVMDRAA